MMLKVLAALFFVVSGFQMALADQPRHRKLFTSANSKYEARLLDGQWRLIETTSGQELYRFHDTSDRNIRFSSMTLVIGDDGKSVVVIDDYSEQLFSNNPEVLFFLRNGMKVKSYRLNEILESPRFISQSVSHFQWMYQNPPIAITNNEISFQGHDLTRSSFDVTTGDLKKQERDADLSEDTIYVYGKVSGLGDDRHEIEVECVLFGNVAKGSVIPFRSKMRRWDGRGFWESIVLRDGKLIQRKGTIFNACEDGPK